jgi:hypothetical protein
MECALLQRRHVYDELGPVGGVVAHGDPGAVRQGELDLGYPVRVAELLGSPDLGSPDLGHALRLLAPRGRLVKTVQFLAELDRRRLSDLSRSSCARSAGPRPGGRFGRRSAPRWPPSCPGTRT